ncbi:hypothetical protein MHYP_G00264450 [Metynnis hypsauchen]
MMRLSGAPLHHQQKPNLPKTSGVNRDSRAVGTGPVWGVFVFWLHCPVLFPGSHFKRSVPRCGQAAAVRGSRDRRAVL